MVSSLRRRADKILSPFTGQQFLIVHDMNVTHGGHERVPATAEPVSAFVSLFGFSASSSRPTRRFGAPAACQAPRAPPPVYATVATECHPRPALAPRYRRYTARREFSDRAMTVPSIR